MIGIRIITQTGVSYGSGSEPDKKIMDPKNNDPVQYSEQKDTFQDLEAHK